MFQSKSAHIAAAEIIIKIHELDSDKLRFLPGCQFNNFTVAIAVPVVLLADRHSTIGYLALLESGHAFYPAYQPVFIRQIPIMKKIKPKCLK